LTDKINEMSGNLGRGNKTSQVPGATPKSPQEKAAAKSFDAFDKMYQGGVDTQKKSNKATEEQIDSTKGLTKAQEKAQKEQEKLEWSMKRAKDGFTNFGQSLFKEKTNFAESLGSLGHTLSRSYGVVGRTFGGMAIGVGYAIGAMQNFADNAKDMGNFADLSAFKVGSVRQAKLLSGLGDSFIKVIEQSNGNFKALGGTSQEAVDNLSNLSRGLRYGSSYLNSAMKKSLGTDLVKSVNKASRGIAAMGLSTEDQANLSGMILSSTALNAKDEDDARKKFVTALAGSVDSARNLSNAFGMSAKTVIAAMAEFGKTQAGTVADLEGNLGAKEFYALIKENGALGTDPAKLANIALALSKGGPEALGKAGVNLGDRAQYEALQQINRAAQGAFSEKGFDTATYNKNLENERGAIDLAYESRKASQGYNDSYASPAILMKAMLKRRDIASSKIPGDEKAAEEKKGKSETDNIQSMNSLTAALESLRGYMVGLTAAIIGLTGALGAVVLAGGLGALAGGGGGMLGKLGGMFGSKAGGPAAGSFAGWKTGATAMTQGTGGIAGKAGGLMGSIGEKAGGMFSKLGGVASDGMSAFGDFLGKLGDNKTIKGAGTLAILGGALALAAHGFETFGKVTWEGMLKGTVALGGLIGIAKLLDKGSNSILKGAGVIAILGASLLVSAVGFEIFNKVEWDSLVKGALALGILGTAASLLGKMSASILIGSAAIGVLGASMWVAGEGFQTFNKVDWDSLVKGALALGTLAVAASLLGGMSATVLLGAAAIGVLGASMWVAGQGFQSFNEVDWGSLVKGTLAIGALAVGASLLGPLVMPILLGAAAIAGLGVALGIFGLGAMAFAKAAQMFAESIVTVGSIDGANLIAVGAGLAAVGVGMLVFTAGMVAGTASSVLTGIMGLFGAKSPLDRIKDFVPYADKISILGAGIKSFGDGITAIATNVASFDTDALGKLKDKLLEFAAAGSSDEVKLTAEYLSSIGASLGTIVDLSGKLPAMSSITSPGISTDIASSLSPGESIVDGKAGSSLSPEAISQLMGYLSTMQSDLSAIRSNTKTDSYSAPVRLS
jgi:hypothetical protein